VTLDPTQERAEIHEKYPPLSRRALLWTGAECVALVVLGFFMSVDWWFYAGGVLGIIGWEVTKFRLRRNADRFAGLGSQRQRG
jgi:hypothetical protein